MKIKITTTQTQKTERIIEIIPANKKKGPTPRKTTAQSQSNTNITITQK